MFPRECGKVPVGDGVSALMEGWPEVGWQTGLTWHRLQQPPALLSAMVSGAVSTDIITGSHRRQRRVGQPPAPSARCGASAGVALGLSVLGLSVDMS